MKKTIFLIIALILTGLMLAALLTGCGSTQPDSAQASAQVQTGCLWTYTGSSTRTRS